MEPAISESAIDSGSGCEASASTRIEVQLDRRVNFAMQQNDVPVVKSLRVVNESDVPLRGVRLRICAEPAFADSWETQLALVAPGSEYVLPGIDLRLSPAFLSELTERIKGQLRLQLVNGNGVVVDQVEPMELLARDEWGGPSSLAEILAAFVTPNHPAIDSVLRSAADILGNWTGDPSLSGYQSKSRDRVYKQVAAIYAALELRGLTYINPPASFEVSGQRVRLPDRVLDGQMGTCLDLTLLAAAALEQAGIRPLLVLVKQHAFVAAWLDEDCFDVAAVEDVLRLRKRVDLNEIVAFDPTSLTVRPLPGFEGAVREARRRLAALDEFLCVIDVTRARKGGIRPLPDRVERISAAPGAEAGAVAPPPVPTLASYSVTGAGAEGGTESPASRLDRWCRRLLDRSLRNRLLNFRESKKTIPLLVSDLAALEDALADGATFQLYPRPDDLGSADPRDADAFRRRTGVAATDAVVAEELASRRLRTGLSRDELDRRLLDIFRTARVELEEGGASALYLAVGFLSWYETPQSTQQRLAPILLLPVELQRRSVREGYALRLTDDDPRLNVTLLEHLRHDFNLQVPLSDEALPHDDSGINVPLVLQTFRQAIRDIDRWDVLESAQIGFFSFTKFLMWRDLSQRLGDLVQSPVVAHLVSRPDQPFDPDATFPQVDRLDDDHPPHETFCPLPADASQLAAVFAAAQGRSFVLEGPPGTGKSQTITNLIAHCLTNGKTVLFVSEKMAALGVVFDRLQKVGLGRFCLELHSARSQKTEVLAQLRGALAPANGSMTDDWESEGRRLQGLRDDLNAYVRALHAKRSTGETAFQAISKLTGLRDVAPVRLGWPDTNEITRDALASLRDTVDQLATVATSVGNLSGSTWRSVRRTTWSPSWEAQARESVGRTDLSAAELSTAASELASTIGIPLESASLELLDSTAELSASLIDAPRVTRALLTDDDWPGTRSRVAEWIDHGRRRDEIRTDLLARFEKKVLRLDLEALREQLTRANSSWWPASWFRRRAVHKALRAVAKEPKKLARPDLAPTLESGIAVRDEDEFLKGLSEEARSLLGSHWRGGEANWDQLEGMCEWVERFRSMLVRVSSGEHDRLTAFRDVAVRLVTEAPELLGSDAALDRACRRVRTAQLQFLQQRAALESDLDLDAGAVWGTASAPDAIRTTRQALSQWSSSFQSLRTWCMWRRSRDGAVQRGLGPILEALEGGHIPIQSLRAVFERSFYDWWLNGLLDREPALANFFSPSHQAKIESFRTADEQFLLSTKRVAAARLGARVPSAAVADVKDSDLGTLRRELEKKRRQMAVRQLLQKIPKLLPRIKPCLLMSPMSVAQYLDPKLAPFDLVVFDEASQIPVWDAIGALARGKQAVIVGDPKQLPPTSFFERAAEDEDSSESESVEDLESILDECLAARLPWLPLDWHYRSRHESLIAFSNYHYYGNRLLTFPSADRVGVGVSWRHVPGGVYDKGKTRTNRAEADAVVAEVIRRLKTPHASAHSIGVVTFSQAQQTLIEDLLDAARRSDTELDALMTDEGRESVFVKNLENVQGDERDVILFSIGYGPDAQGRVSMHFGPMNRDGGERRLNVAITRARREVVVFSTLRAEQIDLARTRARGVKDLKNFLEYAERGVSAIAQATTYDPEADFESPFEQQVHAALTARNWVVHAQVGCSSYRIDLAVVDPDRPGRYLLGVECDGANYHRAKTARDRDKLREAVLSDLGWSLHRIWSTDWWTDPKREIERVEQALERARVARAETVVSVPELPALSPEVFASAPPPSAEPPPPAEHAQATAVGATPAPSSPLAAGLPRYEPFPVAAVLGRQAEFYEPLASARIADLLRRVVEHEAPISIGLATRRVAAHWGLSKVHEKAVRRVRGLIRSEDVRLQSDAGGEFLWRPSEQADQYEGLRVPDGTPESLRDVGDLPLEEIANGALYLLRQYVSLPRVDLVRETSRLFGFGRMGRHIEDRLLLGVDVLIRRAAVSLEDDRVSLT